MSPRDPPAVNPNRQRILGHILANPGCSLQEVSDAVGLTRTSIVHHLRVLVHLGEIDTERKGRRVLHFPATAALPGPRSLLGLLRIESTRRVLQAVDAEPGRSIRALARGLGLTPHTVRWHLGRLQREGLLQVHGRLIGQRRVELHPMVRQALQASGDRAPLGWEQLAGAAPVNGPQPGFG